MGHDSEGYNVLTAHNTPAQTKATELAQQGTARDLYQRASRNEARDFEALTGQPDGFVPVLASISPTTKVAGSGAFILTATGSNFNEDSKIIWWSSETVTTYVSPTTLTCNVGASAIASAGSFPVTVKTDGSTSVVKTFTVT